jgi:Ran GTPase-activating protein (RanGAP) involved in mRNA processing and transport
MQSLQLGSGLTAADVDAIIAKHLVKNSCLTSLRICDSACDMLSDSQMQTVLQSLAVSPWRLSTLEVQYSAGAYGFMYACPVVWDTPIASAVDTVLCACDGLRCLTISGCHVTAEAASVIAQAVSRHACVESLNLNGCRLQEGGGHAIATLIASAHGGTNLTSLDVSNNHITAHATCAIMRALSVNSRLRRLDVSYNDLDIENMSVLTHSLQQNSSLTSLKMRACCLEAKHLRALAEALATNTALTHLDVAHNRGLGNSGSEVLARLLQENSQIERLNVEATGIVEGGLCLLGEALASNCTLQCLSVGHVRVSSEDWASLSRGLRVNSSLQMLSLKRWLSSGTSHVAEVARHCHALQYLDLSLNGLDDEDMTLLADALKGNDRLLYLDVSGHSLSEAGVWSLCNALAEHNTTLRVLLIGYLGPSGIEPSPLRHLMEANTCLRCIHACVSSAADYTDALAGLSRNSVLQSLRLDGEFWGAPDGITQALAHVLQRNATVADLSLPKACSEASMLQVAHALQQHPRYHALSLNGVPLTCIQHVFDLPTSMPQAWWSDHNIVAYIQSQHVDKFLGFAMGQHQRLGCASVVRVLTADILCVLMLSYFGLPLQYFDRTLRCLDPVIGYESMLRHMQRE